MASENPKTHTEADRVLAALKALATAKLGHEGSNPLDSQALRGRAVRVGGAWDKAWSDGVAKEGSGSQPPPSPMQDTTPQDLCPWWFSVLWGGRPCKASAGRH